MDKIVQLDKHHIEAWGLWWVQWQKQTKERLQKQSMSPQSFVNTHLSSVGPQREGFSGNSATSSAVALVLLPK